MRKPMKTAIEKWITDEFNPMIREANDRFDAPMDRLAIAVMSRRLAINGISLHSIIDEVTHHYNHQKSFIERETH
jgi:hypothetical protein